MQIIYQIWTLALLLIALANSQQNAVIVAEYTI